MARCEEHGVEYTWQCFKCGPITKAELSSSPHRSEIYELQRIQRVVLDAIAGPIEGIAVEVVFSSDDVLKVVMLRLTPTDYSQGGILVPNKYIPRRSVKVTEGLLIKRTQLLKKAKELRQLRDAAVKGKK